MQRFPQRKVPMVLFTRATSEWINRVNQKHKELSELQLSDAQKQRLDRWTEIEFVYSTLTLEGNDINQERVARLVSHPRVDDASSENDRAAVALLGSLRTIASLARESGRDAQLSADLL